MSRLWPKRTAHRWIVGVVAFFALMNLAAFATSTVRPEPSGEIGSAAATQPRGAAAYAELLRRSGHRVTFERAPLGEARLDPQATLVVLEARGLDGDERAALGEFVRGGGRLVAAGRDPGSWLGSALARPPRWSPGGPTEARPSLPIAETAAVQRVASAGRGGFDSPGGALPALGADPALLVVARAGAGRALLLADASPLENGGLARADNATLALALAGAPRRGVVFVESVHGERSGLAALPARWKVALGGIVLAALLWLASRARRLGEVEHTAPDPTPARREHVDALALALRRARDPRTALEPVREAAREQVRRRAALAPAATDAQLRDAAQRLGFDDDEVAALTGAVDDDTTLAVGRALAKGRR